MLIGLINTGPTVYLCSTHLGLFREWRNQEFEEYEATSDQDVMAALDTLDIPHLAYVMKGMFPGQPFYPMGRTGTDIRIPWDDFGSVLHWMPSFQKRIDAAEAAGPDDLKSGRVWNRNALPPEKRGPIRKVRARRLGFHTDEGVVLLGRDGGGVLYRRGAPIPTD
ncbi:hypothetical protein [Streptomyces sp. NBC_01637]|uniref:hypothetical protein n=1 Tax=unclassified Streptomyces TaxID=2593676 RepID=UPI00386BC66C|nr:hypothetical protein OH719_26025 [Streptomyces sp. NBC_01653]WTD89861.1 hypothetical protein OG891_20845 [Streptomyces sp. NBC_01637]